jgi:exopolyphosphatase / guanosine-5'-triphosphate,3'-diphosphate pyrophosphatase
MAAPGSGRRRRARVAAAIDVGAYSVHLLSAEVHGHRLDARFDESAALQLGSVVDERGELGFAAGTRLVDTLAAFAALARERGATLLCVVATDPFRRAGDAEDVIEVVEDRIGARIEVLRHEEEALLALLGAQAGRPVLRRTALLDVGGGSSEILLVEPGGEPLAVGLPLGAARLSRTFVTADPPSPADMDALLAEARRVVAGGPDGAPEELLAVGGTASNLIRVGPPLSRSILSVTRIRQALTLIMEMPADVIASRYGLKPSRARVLPGGAAILLAAAERYGLDRVRVSHDGLREGIVLAAAHAGGSWRDHLEWLAHGWVR